MSRRRIVATIKMTKNLDRELSKEKNQVVTNCIEGMVKGKEKIKEIVNYIKVIKNEGIKRMNEDRVNWNNCTSRT